METTAITALLTALGATPDEVAATLKAYGIQGVRNSARFLNPLVRYLQSQVSANDLNFDVMKHDQVGLTYDDGTHEEAALPEACRLFLQAFDAGAYPELELP